MGLAIAHVHRDTHHAHDRAAFVPQRLHVRIVAAGVQADLVGNRLSGERPPVRGHRLGAHFVLGLLLEERRAHDPFGQDLLRFETGARPRHDAQLGVGRPEHRGGLIEHQGEAPPALALGVVHQTDAHARQLERQTFPAAPLDAGRRRLRRVTSHRRDAPTPPFEAARDPAARRAARRQHVERAQRGLEVVGDDGGETLRVTRGQQAQATALVGVPDAHAGPLEGKRRPAEHFLPPLLHRTGSDPFMDS